MFAKTGIAIMRNWKIYNILQKVWKFDQNNKISLNLKIIIIHRKNTIIKKTLILLCQI